MAANMYLTSSSGTRYSMPATGMKSQQRSSVSNAPVSGGLGPLNTTSFLFDDNDDKRMSVGSQGGITSPQATSFLQMTPVDDNFPTLRSDVTSGIVSLCVGGCFASAHFGAQLSANSAALDLANSRSPDHESWASFTRPRPSHQSMPQTGLNMFRPVLNSPPDERTMDMGITQAPASIPKPQRHSMGVTFSGVGESSRYEQPGSNVISSATSRPMSLQSSYSTNDLPTVKNSSGIAIGTTLSKTYAEQQFHNHNASLGRIPSGAVNSRQSRDFTSAAGTADFKREDHQGMQSMLQASAAPFGPHMTSTAETNSQSTAVSLYTNPAGTPGAAGYGYSMGSYNLSQTPANNQLQSLQAAYNSYSAYGGYGRLQDGQGRVVQQRRQPHGNEAARFDNVPLENYRGKLYELCKDQHGCRYLQKRLEEKNTNYTMMIFEETCPFVIELMTGKETDFLCLTCTDMCRSFWQLSLPEIA
jgi:Pumilio-family RNA binding repeat